MFESAFIGSWGIRQLSVRGGKLVSRSVGVKVYQRERLRRMVTHAGGAPCPPKPLGVRRWSATPSPPGAVTTIETFLDYCCPFSAKCFIRFHDEILPGLEAAGIPVCFVFQNLVQPWHPQSTLMHEAAVAVQHIGGDDAFWTFSRKLFERQKDFFDLNVLEKTRYQIYRDLCKIASESTGIAEDDIFSLLEVKKNDAGDLNVGNAVTQKIKWIAKYTRRHSVHVTPTFFVNDIEDTAASSSWGLEEWKDRIIQFS